MKDTKQAKNYKVSNLAENDPTITTVEKAQKRASLLLEVTAVTTANSVVTTFSNGSLFPSLGQSDHTASVQMDPVLGKNIHIKLSLNIRISNSKFTGVLIDVWNKNHPPK